METRIRKIGNSQGLLLSKSILAACQIDDSDDLNLSVSEGKIIIEKIKKKPRQDWEEMLTKANSLKDISSVDVIDNQFDREEWTW